MNKAAFLNIINHVSAISEQEVADLEKLAASFPYCQTAHLLLAKAAYDHGSMLSNQRLRRAAACATNRQLLKKLIYTAAPELVVAPIETHETGQSETNAVTDNLSENKQQVDAAVLSQENELSSSETETLDVKQDQNLAIVPEAAVSPPVKVETPIEVLAEDVELSAAALTAPEAATRTETAPVQLLEQLPEPEPEEIPEFPLKPAIAEDQDNLFIIDNLTAATSYHDPVATFLGQISISEPEALVEEALSAYIFPDGYLMEAGNTVPPETTAPKEENSGLPSTLDEGDLLAEPAIETEPADATLAQFDEYLFKPEKEADTDLTAPYKEEIIYKVFSQNDLGYWMASSRLGETLQVKDDLTPSQPYYFQPELILEYSKQHELETYLPTAERVLSKQFDLIDQFLRQNPKLKSMANIKVKAEPLEDLSSRSTKIKKNLASETLANILVKQGKTKKAIKIYEHLMLKIPEKKAYFASQIQNLQKLT